MIQAQPRVFVLTVGLLLVLLGGTSSAQGAGGEATQPASAASAPAAATLAERRRQFQVQELITSKPFTYVFSPGEPPRVVWRDVEEVRRLGGDRPLRVRWFDAELNEHDVPETPGRWGALVETTAPNGTPVRRAITFFVRPPGFFLYWPAGFEMAVPPPPAPAGEAQARPTTASVEAAGWRDVWREHQPELDAAGAQVFLRAFNDSEAGAVLLSGLHEARPLGRPPRSDESLAAHNEQFHLSLKLKAMGLSDAARPLAPPRRRATPAPVLREGPPAEAGARADAKARIDAVCREWAADSGEPFVTLVARRGVVVTHEPFGTDAKGRAIGRDYRADVASITKSITALLFARFLDQGRVRLDDLVSTAFPDWPDDPAHVPTFRQCFTHTSGFTGHGEFGGVRNPHFENVLLNAIDANAPGRRYDYTGTGIELAAKAMEVLTGTCAARLYYEGLCEPLGLGDLPMASASSGGQPTAWQLGVLAQVLSNGGSYGEVELFSREVFESMLPEPLGKRYPGVSEVEGIGMHWMHHAKPGRPAASTRPADWILGPRTIGHGSLTGCVFLIDPDRELVIVQVRRAHGERSGEWMTRFLETVAAVTADGE